VTLAAGGSRITVEFAAAQPLPAVGETLRLRVDPAAVQVLLAEGNETGTA
jgi:hypothetical protein